MVQYNQITAAMLLSLCTFSTLTGLSGITHGYTPAYMVAGLSLSATTLSIAAFLSWKNKNPVIVGWMFVAIAVLTVLSAVYEQVATKNALLEEDSSYY